MNRQWRTLAAGTVAVVTGATGAASLGSTAPSFVAAHHSIGNATPPKDLVAFRDTYQAPRSHLSRERVL